MTTKALPIVHLNGTSLEALDASYRDALRASYVLLDKLEGASPNARDYYPLGDEIFPIAAQEHMERIEKVRSIRDDLIAILDHLLDYEEP